MTKLAVNVILKMILTAYNILENLKFERILKMEEKYFRPSVTVDSIIFTIRDSQINNYRKLPEKKLQILLVKRGQDHLKINGQFQEHLLVKKKGLKKQ